jgi:hypothetical protein
MLCIDSGACAREQHGKGDFAAECLLLAPDQLDGLDGFGGVKSTLRRIRGHRPYAGPAIPVLFSRRLLQPFSSIRRDGMSQRSFPSRTTSRSCLFRRNRPSSIRSRTSGNSCANWLSTRIFKSHEDILDHCCFAWNKLIDMPWKIMSIGDWAYRSPCSDIELFHGNVALHRYNNL